MSKLKLSYFDFHGGRGEPVRLALSMGGIEFEDHRLRFSDWPAFKLTTPFGSVPVLTFEDGSELAQSNTILRYVGRLTGLYPADARDAARCDEIMDAVEDGDQAAGPSMRLRDPEQLKAAREALVAGPLTTMLTALQSRLTASGGAWFVGETPTVADLKVFVCVRRLCSGGLDHVPTDLVERLAPALLGHATRVRSLPGVAAWHDQHGVR